MRSQSSASVFLQYVHACLPQVRDCGFCGAGYADCPSVFFCDAYGFCGRLAIRVKRQRIFKTGQPIQTENVFVKKAFTGIVRCCGNILCAAIGDIVYGLAIDQWKLEDLISGFVLQNLSRFKMQIRRCANDDAVFCIIQYYNTGRWIFPSFNTKMADFRLAYCYPFDLNDWKVLQDILILFKNKKKI